jgi:formylglycine-generating enzyme required for sulfatase activity
MAEQPAKETVNSIGMRLVLIPAGKVVRGSDDGYDDERPPHEIEITRPFYLGVCEVTQEQHERVTGENPSWFSKRGGGKNQVQGLDTRNFPVETVSWEDAKEFCTKLSVLEVERAAGRVYRLPTEAEWEYACRGRAFSADPFHFGKALNKEQANFFDSKLGRTCKVGSYPVNDFGLHDMHGNVYEWCEDYYSDTFYAKHPKGDSWKDPQCTEKGGNRRVLRGGSWYHFDRYCRAANRHRDTPGNRYNYIGFRVVFAPGATTP